MRVSLRKYWALVACLNYVACLEGHGYCDRSQLTPCEAVDPARAAHNSSISCEAERGCCDWCFE